MSNVSILIRNSVEFGEPELEIQVARKHFDQVYPYRTQVPEGSLVIGRYSVLPYYRELEAELALRGSRLINTYAEHRYIADICAWYEDLKDFTPKTYTQWGRLNEGEFIVKGKTSSRKHQWNTHMRASGREGLLKVIRRLMEDPFISQDGLVVREYIPLKKVAEGINGLPIVKEWRLFFYKENYLAGGFYWVTHLDEYQEQFGDGIPQGVLDFAKVIAPIVSKRTNFYVMDIAEKEDGGFVLIELNDGQMSGLSCNDPDYLYARMREILK